MHVSAREHEYTLDDIYFDRHTTNEYLSTIRALLLPKLTQIQTDTHAHRLSRHTDTQTLIRSLVHALLHSLTHNNTNTQ